MRASRISARVLLIIAVILGSLWFTAEPARAASDGGSVPGAGNCFAAMNSTYLNATLCSSETVNVTLESVPKVISFTIRPVGDAMLTEITLSGLEPNETYYRHQDGYGVETFVSDGSGNYSYTQDLASPHHIFIDQEASTYYIRDDATGGACTSIGTWDSPTKTCTLTTDVSQTIVLDASGITLNGGGHSITRGVGSYGVYVSSRSGVVIKNVVVLNFPYGIALYTSAGSTLDGNTVSSSSYGIYLFGSGTSTVTGNTVTARYAVSLFYGGTLTGNAIRGVGLYYQETIGVSVYYTGATAATVKDNTISTANQGILVYYAGGGTFTSNAISSIVRYSVGVRGFGIHLVGSSGATIAGNTLSGMGSEATGVSLEYGSSGNTISGNAISVQAESGIALWSSSNNNIVTANTITAGDWYWGILLSSSLGNTLTGNTMTGGAIFIEGSSVTHWNTHTIDDTNTARGKPVRYCKDATGGTIPAGAGQVILANCSGVTVEGQDMGYSSVGILLGFSSGNTIRGNSVSGGRYGMHFYASPGNTVNGNTVTRAFALHGIYLRSSNGNTVSGNAFLPGISSWWTSAGAAIYVEASNSNTITGNTVSGGYDIGYGSGVDLVGSSSGNVVSANSISGTNGIRVTAPGNTVSENTISVGGNLAIFVSSAGNVVSRNTVSSGGYVGVTLSSANSNTVDGNTITVSRSTAVGMNVESSVGNTITANSVSVPTNGDGVRVYLSNFNILSGNTVTGGRRDILLSSSLGNTLTGNTMTGGAIFIEGSSVTHWNTHTIDDTNTARGKPVRYCKDATGGTIPAGAGQVILANCSGVTVEGQDMSGAYAGILLGFSSGNTIRGNLVTGSYYGMYLHVSPGNTVSGNTVTDIGSGGTGIFLVSSGSSAVSGNTIAGGTYGIYLASSGPGTVKGNAISGSPYGIYLASSGSSTVRENTISGSGHGIYLTSSPSSTVSANEVTVSGIGIALESSGSSTVSGNTVLGSSYQGLRLYSSSSSAISGNTVTITGYGATGIQLEASSAFTVTGNSIMAGSTGKGILLSSVTASTIRCNAVRANYYGFYLVSSSGNTIFHNNVARNVVQLFSSGSTNTWDNGAGQGSFWYDYYGLDDGSGGRTPGDGVGDTSLPHREVDWYPLMRGASCAPTFPPTITSFIATPKAEGIPVVFIVGATDDERDPLTYSFDFEGDGTYDATGPSNTATHVFPDDFAGTARVRVSDGANTVEATAPVVVTNAAPLVSLIRLPPGTLNPSGTPVTFTAAFTDAGALDTHTATWTFDGMTFLGTITEAGGSGTVTDTFTFSTPITLMTLRVTDDDGGWSQVSNQGPTITSFTASSYYQYEGFPVAFTAYAFDADGNPITYGFDFQGDGTIDVTGSSNKASHVYLDDFQGTAVAYAGDLLLTAERTTSVSVANYPPAVYITRIEPQGGGYSPTEIFASAEGVLATFEFNGDTLDSSGNGRHATFLGGDFVPSDYGQGLHVYLGYDPSTYDVLPMGIDWSAYAQGLKHPFTVEVVFTPSWDAGYGYQKLLSFDDASDDGWYYNYCGFEAYPNPGVGYWTMCPGTRHYLALVSTAQNQVDVYVDSYFAGSSPTGLPPNPSQAIFFRDDSATSRYEQLDAVVDALRISSVARSWEEIAAIQERLMGVAPPVPVGTTVSFAGAFWDPGLLDTHTATWSFDDVTIPGVVNEAAGSGTVSGTYTFTATGVYEIRLTVTDDDGGVGISQWVGGLTALVVVYDPNGGYATGGGWIDSPPGAYAYDPSVSGRATFGFVSKYLRGQSYPSGDTEFRFQAANLYLTSNSYQWLVCGGAKCQFKGWGILTIGQGPWAYQMEVGFMVTAVDGNLPGGGGADKFRIKIWNRFWEADVIYDNMMGWPDDADLTTAIGGGSISIKRN